MISIGITGPSGAGKSEFSSFLKENGLKVINCDELAKTIRDKKETFNKLKKIFPANCFDFNENKIINKNLGYLVFNSEKELSKLNKIMFPLLIKEVKKLIKENKTDIIIFDMPILFESKSYKFLDKVVLVDADRDIRLKRLINGRKISSEIAKKQIDSIKISKTDEQKIDLFILNNNDKEEALILIKNSLLGWINSLKR